MSANKPKVTFGKTEYLFGDPSVPIILNGEEIGALTKCTDGSADCPEWYAQNSVDIHLVPDNDYGTRLAQAKKWVKEDILERIARLSDEGSSLPVHPY